MDVCPDCVSGKLSHTNDGLVCKRCGLVIEEPVTSGSAMLL